MKYVVRLVRKVMKTVIVEAENEDEADKKLKNNDIVREYEVLKTDNTYNGFEYVFDTRYEDDDEEGQLIYSIDDLASIYGVNVKDIENAVYKSTECGMTILWNNYTVTLIGYVEDSECEPPKEKLDFPFTLGDYNNALKFVEEESDYMWKKIHYEEGDAEEYEN